MPVSTVLLFHFIMTFVAVKRTLHPWSHKVPTDRSAFGCSAGKMCASHADGGTCGRCIDAVCVDVMCEPFGNVT